MSANSSLVSVGNASPEAMAALMRDVRGMLSEVSFSSAEVSPTQLSLQPVPEHSSLAIGARNFSELLEAGGLAAIQAGSKAGSPGLALGGAVGLLGAQLLEAAGDLLELPRKSALKSNDVALRQTKLMQTMRLKDAKHNLACIKEKLHFVLKRMQVLAEHDLGARQVVALSSLKSKELDLGAMRDREKHTRLVTRQDYRHAEKKMELEAVHLSNQQELTAQREQLAHVRTVKQGKQTETMARMLMEFFLELQRDSRAEREQILSLLGKLVEQQEKPKATAESAESEEVPIPFSRLQQLSPALREVALRFKQPTFHSRSVTDQSLEGVSLSQLLTAADSLSKAARQRLQFHLETVLHPHLGRSQQQVLEQILSLLKRRENTGSSLCDDLFRSPLQQQVKKETLIQVLRELLAQYTSQFKYIKTEN